MPSCCVPQCRSRLPRRSRLPGKECGITFHLFPKDPKRRKQWIEAIRPDRPSWEPARCLSVCSKHFLEEHFDRTSPLRVRLHSNAVPALLVPLSTLAELEDHLFQIPRLCHPESSSAVPAVYVTSSLLPAPHQSLHSYSRLNFADDGAGEVPAPALVVELASSEHDLPGVEDPLHLPSSPPTTVTASLPPSRVNMAPCGAVAFSGLDLPVVEEPVEPPSPSTTLTATSPSSSDDTEACGAVASSGLDFLGVEDPVRPSSSCSTVSATSTSASSGKEACGVDLTGEERSCAPSYTIVFDATAATAADTGASVEMSATVEEETLSVQPLEKPHGTIRVHNVPIVFELIEDASSEKLSSSECASPSPVKSSRHQSSRAFQLSFGQNQSGLNSTDLASKDALSGRGFCHEEVDALLKVLASVGRIADQVAPSRIDAVMASLEEDIRRPECPVKVRQILSDVLELRATQWQLESV